MSEKDLHPDHADSRLRRRCAFARLSDLTRVPQLLFQRLHPGVDSQPCTTDRAGKFSWKYDQCVSSMMPQSFKSLKNTVAVMTRSIEDPVAARTALMFAMTCFVWAGYHPG
jgi:hypothetical protein